MSNIVVPEMEASSQAVDAQTNTDIVETYERILASDPELTMPVAAIEALINVLGQTTSSTVMETLDIIRTAADRLRTSVPNPVPLAAGTDLFQQYLLRSLKKQDTNDAHAGFEETRQYLIRNSRVFASRAKQARAEIAERGARIIGEGSCVLTGGGSRTIAAVLLRAAEVHSAEFGSPRFKVVYVVDPRFPSNVVENLRSRGVPVAEVSERDIAHVLRTTGVDFALLGAEVLCQSGGVLSRIGTYNIVELVAAYKKPVYFAAESHKIARVYPLSQLDLPRCGVQQQVANFTTSNEPPKQTSAANEDPIDYTPPKMITKVITEYGTKTPSGIYEMLLDIYS
ncbi:hypothetical protein MCOR27_000372 [Pyricularia oryzae]|uniref:Translation initiation factor eIF2B subunit alpha n=2 Tax=Pyricularia TaxID=48558 RepID=A0ABQ8NR24_PYRGI|nr:hypothetical protein MCOR01_000813 [Pyricularia oryzae]KAI6300898.1 hypothetical protein MCOR33_003523 [Pyricularia grisea]KAH9428423.1 hypothetical protein MCOR02_010976 [Pyricularia oryzae]KAI6259959.1 hypothetical protein MCOR19_003682 [Pyricularia oryzae]KAI6285512.1 hypothetical protein MCOR26_001488 [Pyricularia oryzae]